MGTILKITSLFTLKHHCDMKIQLCTNGFRSVENQNLLYAAVGKMFSLPGEPVVCFLLTFRLKDHVADKNKLPILIFPEGKYVTLVFLQ